MKKATKFIYSILVLALFFASCEEKLDTAPDGSTVTGDQLEDILAKWPDRLQANITGFSSFMVAFPAVTDNNDEQDDFGYPSIATRMEHNGQDMVGDPIGYNWFRDNQTYEDRLVTSDNSSYMWRYFYKHIKRANDVLKLIDPETTDPIQQQYIGQALVIRAHNYLHLAQLYQYTYKGNEDKPCVPIITESTTSEEILNNPRVSVSKVYEFIMSDLDRAVLLLEGFVRADVTAVNQAVAYGVRARANLVMENWAGAASDAQNALAISGATPYTLAEVSEPNFDDATHNSVIWGGIITEEDAAVKSGICNFTSMVTSLCYGYGGYTTIVSVWKKINVNLYNRIADSDVRKGWWINDQRVSTTVGESWKGINFADERMHPYTNIKFAPNNKEPMDPNNATDFIYMRAEEMILINAEASAMAGDLNGGKKILEDFVKTYRDPNFVSAASSGKSLQDEIWLQRRIEFWGEGQSWFDIKRLKKPILRKENGVTNFATGAIFNIDAEAPIMLWAIPRSEILANGGISEADNNTPGPKPESE